jgi:redox-regulated HSP33 family molecular chaperone
MANTLVGVDHSGSYRIYLTDTTDLVQTAQDIHHATPLATAGLGRVLTGTGIMSLLLKKEDDRMTVNFRGDGPAGQILAVGRGDGCVKGYIANPDVDLPLKSNGKLDVGGSLGDGELTVIKDLGLKEPWSGTIAFVSGEIAEDLTAYYYVSEQQNTSFALGVRVGKDGRVECAGGLFIQMLPLTFIQLPAHIRQPSRLFNGRIKACQRRKRRKLCCPIQSGHTGISAGFRPGQVDDIVIFVGDFHSPLLRPCGRRSGRCV